MRAQGLGPGEAAASLLPAWDWDGAGRPLRAISPSVERDYFRDVGGAGLELVEDVLVFSFLCVWAKLLGRLGRRELSGDPGHW